MESEILNPQVLVVGAGPVGVPLAIGLKQKGYDVLLVERAAKPGRYFKGEYLQPAGNQFLTELGITAVFEQTSTEKIRELRFRDLNPRGEVQADLLMAYPGDNFALSITHFDLLTSLWSHAKLSLGESFWTGTQLKPKNQDSSDFHRRPVFTAEIPGGKTVTVAPDWVIGCDGRMSTVRGWMGGDKAPRTAPVTWFSDEEFIVGAEIREPAPTGHRYEVIRSYGQGTISAFSLGRHGQRVYFSAPDMEGNLNVERRKDINAVLETSRSFVNLGSLDEKTPLVAFPAYTSDFGIATKGRFLLAGDAANVTTPYGGQGMTSGMEHARHLLENFDFAVSNRFQKRHYQNEVDRIFSRISLINFGLYYLFFARNPMFKSTSSYVINLWEANPDLKNRVVRLFGGLDTETPHVLELMKLWGLDPKTATGRLLPQRLLKMVGSRSLFPGL